MTKQDPAKVKARKDRRRARAEEARMSSRRGSSRQSYQSYDMVSSDQQVTQNMSAFQQQVPPERLVRHQPNFFGGEASLEPLSLSRQESGSADLVALSRYNLLEYEIGFRDQVNESKNESLKRDDSRKC